MSSYLEMWEAAKATYLKDETKSSGKKYRTATIVICEVENGHTVDITWSFNNSSAVADRATSNRDFIAANDKAILKIISDVLPEIKTPVIKK